VGIACLESRKRQQAAADRRDDYGIEAEMTGSIKHTVVELGTLLRFSSNEAGCAA